MEAGNGRIGFIGTEDIYAVNIIIQWQEVVCVSTKQAHRRLSEYITWNVIRECVYWISAFCCH